MSAEATKEESPMQYWNLSDDDDFEDTELSEDDEVDHKLEERVEELIKKIKSLLHSDSYALELKDVPSYVPKKSIEDFFSIRGNDKAEVVDHNPNTKRDVIVYFYDVDLFCEALKKNGRLILSYTFDVVYNPNLRNKPRNRVPARGHREDRGGGHRRGGHGGDSYRLSGDVRKLDNRHQGGNQHEYQKRGNYRGLKGNHFNQPREEPHPVRNRFAIDEDE